MAARLALRRLWPCCSKSLFPPLVSHLSLVNSAVRLLSLSHISSEGCRLPSPVVRVSSANPHRHEVVARTRSRKRATETGGGEKCSDGIALLTSQQKRRSSRQRDRQTDRRRGGGLTAIETVRCFCLVSERSDR